MRRLLLVFLLVPQIALGANQFVLAWDFPHTFPGLTGFQITVADMVSGTQDVLHVPPSVAPACGTGADVTPDTFCAVLPTCPPTGVYAIAVQAVVGSQMSSEAEAEAQALLCHVTPGAPCQCQAVQGITAPPAATHPSPQVPTAQGPATSAGVPAPQPPTPAPTPVTPPRPAMPTFPTLTTLSSAPA